MAKRKKKTPRKKLEEELDKLSKDCAKLRDNYICQWCGKSGSGSQIHGSHVHPVSGGKRLRWDLENIKALCAFCHRRRWHSNPIDAAKWFEEKFPDRWYYIQQQKQKGSKKWSLEELEELKKELLEYKESIIKQEDEICF